VTLCCSVFETHFGAGAVYADDHGVVKVEIPNLATMTAPARSTACHEPPSELTREAAELLQRYFAGDSIDFRHIPVVLAGVPVFRKQVLLVIRMLKYGEIQTYGQVAAACNTPHGARAAGGALAANPIPIIIPCHRVVAANGRLTGFSAPGGIATKRLLLEMEGIIFKGTHVAQNQLVMHSIFN
jgi:methylated-DNA-[protein]-cysteine S-methyltransferase